MIILQYDNSLEGFLSAVFEIYEKKIGLCHIRSMNLPAADLFGEVTSVASDREKALRVWKGLKLRLSSKGLDYIITASLSEMPEAEDVLLGFIRHAFDNTRNIEKDFSNKYVLEISRIHKMVHRERHRMKAFIRFQLTRDGIYYAAIHPDFNVIPLIITHFKNRYADQQWLIYDLKRKYGVYYNLLSTETITMDFEPGHQEGRDIHISLDENEELYQQLWKDYFKSVNIASRKNMTLHIRHVPHRYWKYLTEKKPF